ncbi:CheA signal transduction histidine kinase [Alicyclobacillus hesperidum URH17-3-68]|uniref:chemotaxis protein CheA n=1 Tax=Alicyclobacillus hesperidum TaxID=89784 RepID=UPI000281B8D8|nr:chemotaxis protein CheA [Alicyclobacillus hesperidum]EJY55624.1 CheA signal transduction histidine kinase [Alicyclobacillus hesperidum URH17-3-68]
MDISQYLDSFLAESEDNLATLDDLCLALERDGASDDTLAAMFRAAHTLKGMSATMGFMAMADLTHHMEDALGHIRNHPTEFQPSVVDTLLAAIDALTANLDQIRDRGSEEGIDHSAILQRLAAVVETQNSRSVEGSTEAGPPVAFRDRVAEILRSGREPLVIQIAFAPECTMKAVRLLMVERAVESFGECAAVYPDVQALEADADASTAYLAMLVAHQDADALLTAIREISEITTAVVVELESIVSASGEREMNQARQETAATVAVATANETPAHHAAAPSTGGKVRDQTLRVPVSRIDEFMNVLSELVIAKTRLELLAQRGDHALREVTEQIARLTSSLQDGVMQMRMMPVESLFQRFPRMMRDLQKTLGREFEFVMTGLETEMDRTVMDEMGEALVHLLRNAADHGLEPPEVRERNGKPRKGTIRLSAYASGGHVYLEVADDGAGIDRDRVLNSAIGKGLVDERSAQNWTDAQVYDLLFASGFSTAEKVSDISGRGVGLDAVRGKVESLGGDIRVESVPGQGTTFVIELPLTLAILPAMLVQLDNYIYAIPTGSVEEVARLSAEDIDSIQEQPVYRYRDGVVPIVDLGDRFFDAPCRGDYPWNAVICKEGKRRLALIVDDIVDELGIVNKPLGRYLGQVEMFSGATILGDGRVALIIDVRQLF